VFTFLLTKKWIAVTLVVILVQPALWSLSQWQWRRLSQRLAYNSVVLRDQALPPVSIGTLRHSATSSNGITYGTDSEWRSVYATGTWDVAHQVLVRKKSQESDLGFWVITPLDLSDGSVLMVNRGWRAAEKSATDTPTVITPPAGVVETLGRIRNVKARTKTKPNDLPVGQVDVVAPTEIVSGTSTIRDVYIEMTNSRPNSVSSDLKPIPAPTITEGPHRSYALQWIFFMIMTVIGWVILVRNEVLGRTQSGKVYEASSESAN